MIKRLKSGFYLLLFIFLANCNLKSQPKLLFSFPLLNQNSTISSSNGANYEVIVSATNLALSEGGTSNSFTLSLTNAPTSDVIIQCSTDAQLSYTNSSVTFTQLNYSIPQTISLNAVDDLIKQGDRTTSISFMVSSADSNYNNKLVTAISVQIADNDTASITAFTITNPAATGIITGNNISISVPFGTNVTALVATYTTTGASVSVGATTQVSGTTPNDFTSPVTYTVTAADSSTQNYIVTVTVALNPAKAITAFSFATPAATGVISGNTITVSVPNGTNVNSLVPSITITGASVSPASGVAQNFTSPVVYTVTAADSTTATYTVTVSDMTAKDLTSFSFASIPAIGTFTSASAIAVTVPFGTNLTNLVASFTITGTSINIGGTPQVSGTTTNNFTSPKTYTVVAADATTKTYTVTVTAASNTANSILSFSFANPAVSGSISGTNIAITVPFGTNVTALVPTISINGASVSPASGVAQNFTSPVNYTVTAGNATTQVYTVTVTVATSANSAIVNGSFQSGNVTSVQTNSTATLSTPVNLSKAFVYCGAQIQSSAASTMPTCQLSSPTTIAIQTGASSSTTANWFVVEYAYGVTVQRGSLSLAAGVLSNNVSLSTIDLTKSFALVYSRTNSGSTTLDEERTVIGYFTNSNTLNIERQVGASLAVTVEWQVIEMNGANVQSSGVTPLTMVHGSQNTTPLITAVNLSKSFVFFSYNGGSGIAGVETDLYIRGSLSDSTHVSFTRRGGTGGANKTINIAWFVIEMTDGTTVQKGSDTIGANNGGTGGIVSVTNATPLSPAVSTNKSMIVWSYDTQTGNSANTTQDSATYSGKFNSSTQLQFERYNDENNQATIDWSVVTFQ